LGKIATGKRIEIIYALDLLEKSGYHNIGELLLRQLEEGKDIEVKKYALDRMEALGKVDTAILRSMLNAAKDVELEQKIVSLLCKYDHEFLKKVSENINANDYMIQKIIVINLL